MAKRARAALPTIPTTYSVADVARILQVSQEMVRQLTHRGRLHRLPIDRPWRYSAEEIRRFLASPRPAPGGDEQPAAPLRLSARRLAGRGRRPG